MFLALIKHDSTAPALVIVMPEVFPWVCHLSSAEMRAFTLELVEALSGAAELDADATPQVVLRWRASAKIKADPVHYAEACMAMSTGVICHRGLPGRAGVPGITPTTPRRRPEDTYRKRLVG
ncbi:hypothetical protein [Nonomuraea candida]|uniref:hypothetical protein n=1 Tax=Nonomuraea candida TaxID=359159 RepID=UPI0007C666FE|nr:hypothetical protein [Nonomuraea candida]